MVNYWWINQTYYYNKDHKNDNVSAAVETWLGGEVPTHKRATEMKAGDIILCYRRQLSALVSVGRVLNDPYKKEWDVWDKTIGDEGCAHKVKVEYQDLNPHVPLNKFAAALLRHRITGYPINKNCDVQEGYIHRFNQRGLAAIIASQKETIWPQWPGVPIPQKRY